MKAIILAGTSNEDMKHFGQNKAFVAFKDRPLIEYSIDALKQSEIIDYILVVGDRDLLTSRIGHRVDKIIEEGKDMLDNLLKAASHISEGNIIVSTCDIPLITPEAVRSFIKTASSLNADICYPIIERSICEGKYPDAKRTYASLKDGDFTGGNLMMMNPQKVKALEEHIRPLIQYRKNPIKMTKALGPGLVFQMLSKRLTLQKLESYVKERFNINGKAIITPYPEIGSDIDHVEDIEILEKYI